MDSNALGEASGKFLGLRDGDFGCDFAGALLWQGARRDERDLLGLAHGDFKVIDFDYLIPSRIITVILTILSLQHNGQLLGNEMVWFSLNLAVIWPSPQASEPALLNDIKGNQTAINFP